MVRVGLVTVDTEMWPRQTLQGRVERNEGEREGPCGFG